jgi:hypothetical protein
LALHVAHIAYRAAGRAQVATETAEILASSSLTLGLGTRAAGWPLVPSIRRAGHRVIDVLVSGPIGVGRCRRMPIAVPCLGRLSKQPMAWTAA